MKRMKKTSLLTSLLLFASVSVNAQIQCAVDVQIVEGSSIEMCKSALVPINATNGFADYAWTGPIAGATQSITPTVSGQYIVFATDAVNCISSDTIQVIVHEPPVDNILSSAGNPICGGGTSTLSLSGSYGLYSWTGGVSTPTLDITTSGTYTVSVVDANDCVATFSTEIDVVEFEIDIIGQNNCINTVTLQANSGTSYNWSNGETTSTIVVSPEEETTYSVTISTGTCVGSASITIPGPSQTQEYSLEDTIYIASGETTSFSGPANFQAYVWSPGNQLHDSTVQVVVFNGTETQSITLTATHPDGCIIQETIVVVVVELTVPNGFSPNGDHVNDLFVIPELVNYQGKLIVWNRWGDIVFRSNDYQNNWGGTCDTGACFENGGDVTAGTYFYSLDVGGITKEGYITIVR